MDGKGQKILSLDLDIIQELKSNPNASKLVNDFLLDYFKGGSLRKKTELESKRTKLSAEILEMKEMIIVIDKKLLDIEKKAEDVRKSFEDIPSNIIEDFKKFPNMTEEILKNRFEGQYERISRISWEDLLEAYKIYFKDREEDANNKY